MNIKNNKGRLRDTDVLENKSFVFKIYYMKNWILDRIASNFPIPSVRVKLYKLMGINIGKEVYIGCEIKFDRIHPELITIKDYAAIGDRCIITAHTKASVPLREKYPISKAEVIIGKGVWIAPGCIIIQGVEIGDMSVIATGCVVINDVPPNSLVAGVPGKIIKQI